MRSLFCMGVILLANTLIFLFLISTNGCATSQMITVAEHEHRMRTDQTKVDKEELQDCLQQQVSLYGDLCAEAAGTHPKEESADDAFFYGMMCGLQGVAICIGVDEPEDE